MPLARSLVLALCCSIPLVAQERDRSRSSVDPYTRGDAQALARAGLVGLGPFRLGERFGTADVEHCLGRAEVVWIETAHFKIGAELPPLAWKDCDAVARKRLTAELAALRKVMPVGSATPRSMDPWLRAHLLARRCEALYEDFARVLPAATGPALATDAAHDRFDDIRELGHGPYLGKDEKFVVLVLRRGDDFVRIAVEFLGKEYRWPQRHDLGRAQGMVFGTALDFDPSLADDTALHAHLAHNLVHNFCDAYRGYLYDTTMWWKVGLAHSVVRRIDPRFANYDRSGDDRPDVRVESDWESRAIGLARHGGARPFRESAAWFDVRQYRFHDHVLAWSRIEFLRAQGDEKLGAFLSAMKAPLPVPGPRDQTTILERQERALFDVYNFATPDDLDDAWRAWVTRKK
ncbi:MAG: hypothetical protein HZB39_01485 [Planctomycetes bacterium]|nr:hypothetical protein [Planctomycetota bacterium]